MSRFVGCYNGLKCWFEKTREDLDTFAQNNCAVFDDVLEVDRACMIEGVIYVNYEVPEGMEDVISY